MKKKYINILKMSIIGTIISDILILPSLWISFVLLNGSLVSFSDTFISKLFIAVSITSFISFLNCC